MKRFSRKPASPPARKPAHALDKRSFAKFAAACEDEDEALALSLIPHFTPKNFKATDADGRTALMIAAQMNSPALLLALLPHSKPNASTGWGRNALMFAARDGHYDIAKILLPYSDPRAADIDGINALMLAVRHGYADLTALLLTRFDPLQFDLDRRTALMHAITSHFHHPSIIPLLITEDSVRSVDNFGQTAFMRACCTRPDAARLLLPYADLNLTDARGLTALNLAEFNGLDDLAALIRARLKSDADRLILAEALPLALPSDARASAQGQPRL